MLLLFRLLSSRSNLGRWNKKAQIFGEKKKAKHSVWDVNGPEFLNVYLFIFYRKLIDYGLQKRYPGYKIKMLNLLPAITFTPTLFPAVPLRYLLLGFLFIIFMSHSQTFLGK